MAIHEINFSASHSDKLFWLLVALSLFLTTFVIASPSAFAGHTPAPPPGGGGWQVQANTVCAAPSEAQPACEFSGSVLETGDSTSALQASHAAVLTDAASTLHVKFSSTAVEMNDGTYAGTASIYDSKKRLVA